MVVDVASTIIYLGIGTAIFRPLLGDAAVSLATAAVP
jgi:hypothetical protein